MTLQEELHPASFKNAPFLVEQTSTEGGRKTVTHEFVNSNTRNVEDLGLLQKTFSMTGIITGPDYTQKKEALIAVLDQGGSGSLVHPFFGRVQVVAKPYTLIENTTELGEARFSLVFEKEESEIGPPQPGSSSQATVESSANAMQDTLSADVGDTFEISNEFPRNFIEGEALLDNVGAKFEDVSRTFRNSTTGVDEFTAAITDFNNDVRDLLLTPVVLGNSVKNLFATMRGVATTPKEFLTGLNGFFDFGDDDTEILQTTQERVERLENQEVINNAVRVGALVDSYRFIVTIDFDTVSDIDSEQERLDDQYDNVVESLPTATQTSLTGLRNLVRDFLDGQRISAKRVITIETKTIPAQVLTYSLYGNVDDTEKIIELNETKDVSFISGSVEVLT
jgi:prophage DNA circulation protein